MKNGQCPADGIFGKGKGKMSGYLDGRDNHLAAYLIQSPADNVLILLPTVLLA